MLIVFVICDVPSIFGVLWSSWVLLVYKISLITSCCIALGYDLMINSPELSIIASYFAL